MGQCQVSVLKGFRSPSDWCPSLPFLVGRFGSPSKIDCRKIWYPCSKQFWVKFLGLTNVGLTQPSGPVIPTLPTANLGVWENRAPWAGPRPEMGDSLWRNRTGTLKWCCGFQLVFSLKTTEKRGTPKTGEPPKCWTPPCLSP